MTIALRPVAAAAIVVGGPILNLWLWPHSQIPISQTAYLMLAGCLLGFVLLARRP